MSNQPTKEHLRQVPISMPFSMVDEIDELARKKCCSRAELVRRFTIKGLAAEQKKSK